jgi:hypothetical protein
MRNLISKAAFQVLEFVILSVILMLFLSSCIVPTDIGVSRVESNDPVNVDLRGKFMLVHPVHMDDSVHRRLRVTDFFSKKLKKIVGDSVVQVIQTACLTEEMIDDYPDSFTMDSLRIYHNGRFLAVSHADIQNDSDGYTHLVLTVSILDLETHQYVYDQRVMVSEMENDRVEGVNFTFTIPRSKSNLMRSGLRTIMRDLNRKVKKYYAGHLVKASGE